jgi:CRISPR-associated protein Csm4
MTTWRLRLRPTSPWATPWHADSLFGALAWRCAEAYREEKLLEWIKGFQTGAPPFLLSDALPGDWFPAPLGPAYQTQAGDKAKVPAWVQPADFHRMLQDPGFRAPASLSGGEKSSHADRRQASLDRATDRTDTEGGALFEVEQQILSKDSGGCFSLYIRTDAPAILEALVDLLSVTGFGRKSSTGLGAFELDGKAEPYPALDNYEGANGFVSLSHFVPARTDPTRGAWRTHVSYPKYHGSSVKHPFKGRLVQLTPGSCFHTVAQPRPWYGRAARAGCEEFPEAIQYGFAFAVPAVLHPLA